MHDCKPLPAGLHDPLSACTGDYPLFSGPGTGFSVPETSPVRQGGAGVLRSRGFPGGRALRPTSTIDPAMGVAGRQNTPGALPPGRIFPGVALVFSNPNPRTAMSTFMRFHHTIQAIPAALTPLKRGVWAVWFCLACAAGRRLFAAGHTAGASHSPSHAPAPPLLGAAHSGTSRWWMARRLGNIREGPD